MAAFAKSPFSTFFLIIATCISFETVSISLATERYLQSKL